MQQGLADRGPKNMTPITLDNPPQELQQINGALTDMMLRVKEGIERESRFVSEAAHELRTPLTVLSLHAQQLEQQELPDDAKVALQRLQQGILRGRRLVEQLLSLSRAEGGNHEDSFEQFPIQPLLREIIADLVPLALTRDQVLQLDGRDDLQVFGNREQLRILFSNLVDNALRYTPDGGCVEVTARQSEHDVEISVCDNGPGLQAEQKERIFDRFWRGETGRGDGAGLGMAIVSSLVKCHHGNIELENRAAGGLMVSVQLPSSKESSRVFSTTNTGL